MTSIMFVHGINVRHADFQRTYDVVSRQVDAYLPGCVLMRCEWGDDFGASLRCEGRSIPTYDTSKDAMSVLPEIETAALWAMLYDAPPVRSAAAGKRPGGPRYGGAANRAGGARRLARPAANPGSERASDGGRRQRRPACLFRRCR